jgi:hypothetical protein
MIYIRLVLVISLASLCITACSTQHSFEQQVCQSVENQLEQYSKSSLQDLYKSFFQDKFGPGHIISDTSAARRYLDSELSSFETSSNPEVEPTGWEHNFYRVNLSLIKSGKIPYGVFFDAFVESVNSINPPTVEDWKKEWTAIERVISSMNLSLTDFEKDKIRIDSLLNAGKYAVHHSAVYEETYRPHYRIISRKIFERQLQMYFVESSSKI